MVNKKIPTFKSGNFLFSADYSREEVIDLLIESKILYRTINDLPILPSLASVLQEDIIKRSIFGTAAIEGNPLSEEKVQKIISEPDSEKLKEQAEIEIKNLQEAYTFIKNMEEVSDFFLSEELIKKIHFIITKNIKHKFAQPGYYRSTKVQVGDNGHGGIYIPPKCYDDIKNLMKEFTIWINSEDVLQAQPQIRAALAHYHLALIHPFDDGNGRTARLIEAIILKTAGIKYVPVMLSNYYYRHIDDYFRAFSITEHDKENKVTHFLKFVLTAMVSSLDEIKDRITFFIRKFTLRDYYVFLRKNKDITLRQHELLAILIDSPLDFFTAKSLFEIPPLCILYKKTTIRTAMRDLEKLHAMHLLEKNKKQYRLNMNALS